MIPGDPTVFLCLYRVSLVQTEKHMQTGITA